MAAPIGSRLGPYEIVAPLGAGGMGEVYRARDAKLGRDVALKILPDAFARDPERLGRFEREARTLAALNHPHIAQIYGFEASGAIHALVMELVEGPTLADRIALGPLPLADAVPIAKQIADALEAAHEQGIVHRDLKPANIKVRDDGTVKVLDFGLAKAVDPTSSMAGAMNSLTLSVHATQMGVILGTAAYMAPEQARGKSVDRRADIWAFGAVLFEMLTGEQAFRGETITDILAAVVNGQPDLSRVPPLVRPLLTACLEKEPKRRLQAIADAWFLLDERPVTSQPTHQTSWVARLTMLSAVVLTIFATVLWMRRQPAVEQRPLQFTVNLPAGARVRYPRLKARAYGSTEVD